MVVWYQFCSNWNGRTAQKKRAGESPARNKTIRIWNNIPVYTKSLEIFPNSDYLYKKEGQCSEPTNTRYSLPRTRRHYCHSSSGALDLSIIGGLDRKSKEYKENGKNLSYVDLAHELTELKQEEDKAWLKECANVVLQQSLRNLDAAFTGFFRKKSKYPNFKSKHGKASAKFIENVHFDFNEWKVKLPKIGWVVLCPNEEWNQAECKQGTTTVSKDKCGTYWVSVVIDNHIPEPPTKPITEDTAVGVDLGLKTYAVLSDGTEYKNPKYLKDAAAYLARVQKAFSRTPTEQNTKIRNTLKMLRRISPACRKPFRELRRNRIQKSEIP